MAPAGPWFDTSWAKRIKITVDNSAHSTAWSQPVQVKLTPARVSFADFLANGEDVRAVDDDHFTALPYTIERFNTSESTIWVKVSVAGNQSKDFYIYYSNPDAVDNQSGDAAMWTTWEAIYHMNESPVGTMTDYSPNANALTTAGSMTAGDLIEGDVGGAIDFDGSDDQMSNTTFMDSAGFSSFSIFAGFKSSASYVTSGRYAFRVNPSTLDFWDFTIEFGGIIRIRFKQGATNVVCTSQTGFDDGALHTVAFSWDGSNIRLYVDGNLEDTVAFSGSIPADASNGTFTVGQKMVDQYDFLWVDDADYTADEHSQFNKNFQDTFNIYGAVESLPASTFELKIDGTNRTSFLRDGTLNIVDELDSRNTAHFVLRTTGETYEPAVGESVLITKGLIVQSDGAYFGSRYFGGRYFGARYFGSAGSEGQSGKIFSGSIDRVNKQIAQGGNVIWYTIDCVDHNQIADRHLVAEIFENQSAGFIVQNIINDELAGEGINIGDVEDGVLLDKAVFPYMTAARVFDELAKVSGLQWYIDYDKFLHFFSRSRFAAPFQIIDASDNFETMRFIDNRERYKNRQFLRAGMGTTDTRTEDFIADGINRNFMQLDFEVDVIDSITLEGIPQTKGVRGIDTKDFLFVRGEKEITLDDDFTTPSDGQTVRVTYKGLFPIIVLSDDQVEIAARAAVEGGTGVYDDIEDDQRIESIDFASEKADSLLNRFGRIFKEVQVKINDDIQSTIFRLRAGQLMTINRTDYNVNSTFLITRITITENAGLFTYVASGLDGEHLGGWAKFFEALAEAGRRFSLRQNEKLIVIRKFKETITIAETFTTGDALTDDADDDYTGFKIGFAQIGKSFVTGIPFASETP